MITTTYVTLDVSKSAFDEVKAALAAAGYPTGNELIMNGIAIVQKSERAEFLDSKENRIVRLVSEIMAVKTEEISPSVRLVDLGADSLDFVELIMAIEDEFAIEIDDNSASKIRTVGDLFELPK